MIQSLNTSLNREPVSGALELEALLLKLERELGAGKTRPLESVARFHGCLDSSEVAALLAEIAALSPEAYYSRYVLPTEGERLAHRLTAIDLLGLWQTEALSRIDDGPLVGCWGVVRHPDMPRMKRTLGFVGQLSSRERGILRPRHHVRAEELLAFCERTHTPVVTLIDTPGADAGALANAQFQAHRISSLIAAFARLGVPSVALVVGAGSSGGAIPFATTDRVLSLADAYLSTIHPAALADIVKSRGIPAEECARLTAIAPAELLREGIVDGVVRGRGEVKGTSEAAATAGEALRAIFSALDDIEGTYPWYLNAPDTRDRLATIGRHFLAREARRFQGADAGLAAEPLPEVDPVELPGFRDFLRRLDRSLRLRRRLVWRRSGEPAPQRPARPIVTRRPAAGKAGDAAGAAERLAAFRSLPLEFAPDELRTAARGLRNGHSRPAAIRRAAAELAIHAVATWKMAAESTLPALAEHAWSGRPAPGDLADVGDLIDRLGPALGPEVKALRLSIQLARKALEGITELVAGLDREHRLGRPAAMALLAAAVPAEDRADLLAWLRRSRAISARAVAEAVRAVRREFVRTPAVLFDMVAAVIEGCVPSLGSRRYSGLVAPRGVAPDFWLHLAQAYNDVRIAAWLAEAKRKPILVEDQLVFFNDFEELDSDLVSADPAGFPGFGEAIEKGIRGGRPNAVVTGRAVLRGSSGEVKVAVAVSNPTFQAGAMDMASGEKIARLFDLAAEDRRPVVLFISSGGMQTKEGTGALFTMPVVNDAASRYREHTRLPVIVFGYRDCTGGAQASIVTHPEVLTYYVSGALLPFAGAKVVPEPLPMRCMLANYLAATEGAMIGMVRNPWDPWLDDRFEELADPALVVPSLTVPELLAAVLLEGALPDCRPGDRAAVPEVSRKVSRVLIPNRGDIALTLIRKFRDRGVTPLLGHSRTDRNSLPYREACSNGVTVELGPGPATQSYLRLDNIVQAALAHGAGAIHPGIGFLAENPDFAERCRRAGILFIGPSPEAIRSMGDKVMAVKIMAGAGIPTVPGSHGLLRDVQDAREVAERVGYPIMLKAAAGGGGRGMRRVESVDDLADRFHEAHAEAQSAFGNGSLYLEKCIDNARHIEVQILADGRGRVVVLGERDCTVQYRHQKLIEEAPSPELTPAQRRKVYAYARQAALAAGYENAGTVEFLLDRTSGEVCFMEMNARLQVEYAVTEMVTGVDIISQQIGIAFGEGIALEGDLMQPRGHAIEVRVNAERLLKSLEIAAATGRVERIAFPAHDWLRVETHLYDGYRIPPHYDAMVAKLIVRGRDRRQAIARMLQVLESSIVEGVPTNMPLQALILRDADFRRGRFNTRLLDTVLAGPAARQLVAEGGQADEAGRAEDAMARRIRVPGSSRLRVCATMEGVFYRRPRPDTPPFVEDGQVIDGSTPLCLLESMKRFYAVRLADFTIASQGERRPLYPAARYRVERYLADDGAEVDAGQGLLVVEAVESA